jgi:RimJ/RimL family protein N-acetyltransferase
MSKIYLRELTENDITDEYLNWFSNQEITYFLDSKNLTKNQVLENIENGKKLRTYFMLAVIEKESNKHVGNVKVGPINVVTNVSDLVTVIGDKGSQGKGYGREAILVASQYAFHNLHIRKLAGKINVRNVASVKAYMAAGWIIEGVLRDHDLRNGIPEDVYSVAKFPEN